MIPAAIGVRLHTLAESLTDACINKGAARCTTSGQAKFNGCFQTILTELTYFSGSCHSVRKEYTVHKSNFPRSTFKLK